VANLTPSDTPLVLQPIHLKLSHLFELPAGRNLTAICLAWFTGGNVL
jgi:hypothetical protein